MNGRFVGGHRKMALSLQQVLHLTVVCLACSRLADACLNDRGCPGSKSCCDGICRFSCTCTSSNECDWNEKCCADMKCVDGVDLCHQPFPVYYITVGVCSMAFMTLLCLTLICYWARCCPWYKRRIARRRRKQRDATLERSYFTTVSSTNMTQELRFPKVPPPFNFASPPYSPPFPGNPSKYSSYTVQRTCQPPSYTEMT